MVVLAVLLPVVFGALLLLGLPRALGVLGAGLSFLLNLYLFLTHPGGVAHAFQAPLLPGAGVYWAFGLDGLSVNVTPTTAIYAAYHTLALRDALPI